MVESTEMKIINAETSAKILSAVKNAALSEQIELRVSRWEIMSNVISIFIRLFAVLFNLNLAYEYLSKGEIFFFRMTLCFIFIPALISMILSITMWVKWTKKILESVNKKFNRFRHYEDSKVQTEKKKKGLCSVLLFVVIFPYFFRYINFKIMF